MKNNIPVNPALKALMGRQSLTSTVLHRVPATPSNSPSPNTPPSFLLPRFCTRVPLPGTPALPTC